MHEAHRELYTVSYTHLYEDITGIDNGSAEIFEEMCERYGQVPSFTLARNPYIWFRRAESVTYALNNNGQFAMDPYENAYSSGTHFVTAKDVYKRQFINIGEDKLCTVCTEYPRFTETYGSLTEKGLGMSCESAAEFIFKCDKPTCLLYTSRCV